MKIWNRKLEMLSVDEGAGKDWIGPGHLPFSFWPGGTWDLISPIRARTCALCSGARSLNHWTTREVPVSAFWPCPGDHPLLMLQVMQGLRQDLTSLETLLSIKQWSTSLFLLIINKAAYGLTQCMLTWSLLKPRNGDWFVFQVVENNSC